MVECKPCLICGVAFACTRPTKRYCSTRCRATAQRRRTVAVRQVRVCPGCAGEFMPTKSNHRTCSPRCNVRWHKGLRQVPDERICGYCEAQFVHRDGRRLYCSDDCTRIAKSLRNAEYLYGITMAQYRDLWRAQKGVCAICQCPERTERNRLLVVDHDHRTGNVRSLLCSHCNRAIGLLQDNPAVVLSAALYLEAHQLPAVPCFQP